MKKLITDIQSRLIAQVTKLKYVDMDWGQLDFYFPNPPVQWPCALIKIAQAEYSNAAHRAQLGLVTIVISIADLRISNSSGKAPQGQKNYALGVIDLMNDVYKALHGWTNDKTYTGLIRTSYTQRQREDLLTIHQITFTTEIKDINAIPAYDVHSATPTVTVSLIKQ